MVFRYSGDDAAQMGQIGAGFGHSLADIGPDLDLALQEFRTDLPLKFLNALRHQGVRRCHEIQAVAVNKQVFLFDTKGEAGLTVTHKQI